MNTRIFVAFAVEDVRFRDALVAQAKNDKSPVEFLGMPTKESWNEKWQINCRARVKGCKGVVALISQHTAHAEGELWEIQCAYEQGIPIMLMWIDDRRPALPVLIKGKRITIWSWDNLKTFIDQLRTP